MWRFSMEQFELQKPISQLFGALRSQSFWNVKLSHVGRSEKPNKIHYFRKIIFVTSLHHNIIIIEAYMPMTQGADEFHWSLFLA